MINLFNSLPPLAQLLIGIIIFVLALCIWCGLGMLGGRLWEKTIEKFEKLGWGEVNKAIGGNYAWTIGFLMIFLGPVGLVVLLILCLVNEKRYNKLKDGVV